jgi:chromosomal replication initiator protein
MNTALELSPHTNHELNQQDSDQLSTTKSRDDLEIKIGAQNKSNCVEIKNKGKNNIEKNNIGTNNADPGVNYGGANYGGANYGGANDGADDLNIEIVRQAWEQLLAVVKNDIGQHVFLAYFSPLNIEINYSHPIDSVYFNDNIANSTGLGSEKLNIASQENFPDTLEPQINHEHGLEYDEKHITLSILAPTKLQCQIIKRNYAERIETLLRQLIIGDFNISYDVSPEHPQQPEDNDSKNTETPSKTVIIKRNTNDNDSSLDSHDVYINNLNPRYTFQSFVVGSNNQFCNAAACRVAEKPGESYNPLFIYGGVGLGKTHLLHSIGNAVLNNNPRAKVLYISSEAFTNELIQALRNAKMEEFKSKLRSIEVLLIDDIQFISGKERTQEEFFHTFNTLYGLKRQIVMTSDKIPSEIDGIEERLQTRFAWGLTADLQAPDFETRAAILKRKALLDNFYLPEEVAHLIAESISSNVRELEGALTRLHAVSSLQRVPITLETAQAALKPLLEPKKITVNIDDIKKAVAQHFSIKVSEIISKKRTKNLSFPRHVAMYLCRKHTTSSYPEIGEKFGGRDHSSVIHAASVVANKVNDEPSVKELVMEIERKLFN